MEGELVSAATPPRSGPRVLSLGSGREDGLEAALKVDRNPSVSPDVVHDLDRVPWPFEDNSFDVIYCRDVIEHLQDVVRAMQEIHRIARPEATVHITTPHFSCANSYTDPTHRHHLGLFSFDYFTEDHYLNYYTSARFRIRTKRLLFHPGVKNAIAWRLANRYPSFYEKHLAWIFPAWFISLELEVVK